MSHRIARTVFGLLCFASLLAASDITGIWTGQQPGRLGQVEDVSFRFKLEGQTLTGKLFGDEFDLPITDATVTGDQVRFTVTTTNYFSGTKTVFVYTGTINGNEMELVRERVLTPEDRAVNRPGAAANRAGAPVKQTLKLKRL